MLERAQKKKGKRTRDTVEGFNSKGNFYTHYIVYIQYLRMNRDHPSVDPSYEYVDLCAITLHAIARLDAYLYAPSVLAMYLCIFSIIFMQ